jgi:hypothetical protein
VRDKGHAFQEQAAFARCNGTAPARLIRARPSATPNCGGDRKPHQLACCATHSGLRLIRRALRFGCGAWVRCARRKGRVGSRAGVAGGVPRVGGQVVNVHPQALHARLLGAQLLAAAEPRPQVADGS